MTPPKLIITQPRPAWRDLRTWLQGILAVACLVLAYGITDANDRAAQAQLAASLYARHAERLQYQLDKPAVRIDVDNPEQFRCTQWRIRDPWIGQAAERCAQLGQFILMARTY